MKILNSPMNQREILSVDDLNKQAKTLLEQNFARVWVEGEISNLARPSSGHLYFTLKSEKAQVRCALFRFSQNKISNNIKDGMQVLVSAKLSLYEGRGDYQLIISQLEPAGDGQLKIAFEHLKAKLEKEGLFALERKRELPSLPKHVGVITSATGAAIRDIISVLRRRFPLMPVTIYPTQVQGEQCAEDIRRALCLAINDGQADVLIIGRGGGSLEDLWGFNDEALARAIANCPIPTVSAVGHEVDFTICDFVADCRAPTPSAAAELISPDIRKWVEAWNNALSRCQYFIVKQCQLLSQHFEHLRKRLTSPSAKLESQAQQLDSIEVRLQQAILYKLHSCHQQYHATGRALHAISPLATLARGYSITQTEQGQIITSADMVSKGDEVQIRLHHGDLLCEVK